MTDEELLKETQRAVTSFIESGGSQASLGTALDVHRSSISRALNEGSGKYSDLQRRILEFLTPFAIEDIERIVRYRARKQSSSE